MTHMNDQAPLTNYAVVAWFSLVIGIWTLVIPLARCVAAVAVGYFPFSSFLNGNRGKLRTGG